MFHFNTFPIILGVEVTMFCDFQVGTKYFNHILVIQSCDTEKLFQTLKLQVKEKVMHWPCKVWEIHYIMC